MNSAERPARSVDWISLGLLLVVGGLLGLSTTLAKLASAAGLSALPFLGWSVSGAAVALVAVAVAQGHRDTLDARRLRYFVIAAILTMAAPNLLLFAAIPRVGAGFAALSVAFPPLFTYLGALALGIERFSAARAAGVTIALAGACWLAWWKLSAPAAPSLWVVAVLAVPLLLAAGNIYRTLDWPPGAQPDALAPGMMAAAGAMLLAGGFAAGVPMAVPMTGGAPWLVAAQVATFTVQYLLYFVLQRRGGPVLLSLMGSVAACIGVPLAVLLLGEAVPQGLAVGALCTALGIALVLRKPATT